MNRDDLLVKHEVDQGLAEALELGNIRIIGKNEQGDDLLQLTSKGVLRSACLFFQAAIEEADKERRDFTPEERHELMSHVLHICEAFNTAEA
jgi:hypothetical protein